jgi:hypothetical protein
VGKTILESKTFEVVLHGNIDEDVLAIETFNYESWRATARASSLLAPAKLQVLHIGNTNSCAYLRYKRSKLLYRTLTTLSEIIEDRLSGRKEVHDGLLGAH